MNIFIISLIAIAGIGFLAFSPQVKAFISQSAKQTETKIEQFLKPRRILTPAEIDSIIQKFAPNVSQRFKQGWIDATKTAAGSRRLPQTVDILQCDKAGNISVSSFITAGGGAAASFLPATIATAGILAPIGIFASIFGAHEQAVKNEQNVLCSAVPSANQTLDQIKQLEISGQFSNQEVITALKDLLSQFKSATSSIVKDATGICNAGCGFNRMLSVIVEIEITELS